MNDRQKAIDVQKANPQRVAKPPDELTFLMNKADEKLATGISQQFTEAGLVNDLDT